jgi:DNA-binding NarL/FixJ family response regulator
MSKFLGVLSYFILQEIYSADYNSGQYLVLHLYMTLPVTITILIDDSEVVASRLGSLLKANPAINFAGRAKNIREGYSLIEKINPQVVIINSRLPDGTAISMIANLKQKYPDLQIVILSNENNEYYKTKCLQMGATRVLDRSSDLPDIIDIIDDIQKYLD